jgi:hypothetical protein
MGQRGGVDHNDVETAFGLLDPADQFIFGVRLSKIDFSTEFVGPIPHLLFDIGKRSFAVNLSFPSAQKIKIWAI